MESEDLKIRTQRFAIRIINLAVRLPETTPGRVISAQILRSATFAGANYRAALRSKSQRDIVNKLKIAEERTDETLYWLEMIEDSKLVDPEKLAAVKAEANELLSVFETGIKTAKAKVSTKSEVRSKKKS